MTMLIIFFDFLFTHPYFDIAPEVNPFRPVTAHRDRRERLAIYTAHHILAIVKHFGTLDRRASETEKKEEQSGFTHCFLSLLVL